MASAGQPRPTADLNRHFKNVLGVDIADKHALGAMVPVHDEEAALAGFEPFIERLAPDMGHGARRQLVEHIHGQIDKHLGVFEKYYAMGFALEAGRAAHAPNAVASLMPDLAGAAAPVTIATPGTAYNLVISQGGVVQSGVPFTYYKKQTFHRIMTLRADAEAGWFFVGNTLKFQDDPIAGLFYDCSFSAFEPEIPFDRTPLGAYERRSFRNDATIQFNGQIFINPNSPAAECVAGVMMSYRDDRCIAGEDILDGLPSGNSYIEVVDHLISQRRGLHGGRRR